MGSSVRSELKHGNQPQWELKLREAALKVSEVIRDVYEYMSDDLDYDNTADNGGLAERLSIAKDLIMAELPERPQA